MTSLSKSDAPGAPSPVELSASPERFLIASHDLANAEAPFITVAIPHYKHRRYLEIVLDTIFEQQYDRFEIVVSSDHSPDDSDEAIPPLLQKSGCRFRYYAQPENLGYDGNVRFCLAAARGRYVFLLGNDDGLAGVSTLRQVGDLLESLGFPEVAITNYEQWASPGSVVRRALASLILGSGVEAAVQFFRSFSFVSGLIYDRAAAQRHETTRWDQSIYYQIYLACRILADGGRLGALATTAVRKDVLLDGVTVPNYVSKWRDAPWSFQSRHTGIDSAVRVTVDAVLPYVPDARRSRVERRILAQALLILHPFWVLEYRRTANWSFAVGVARGHYPGTLLREYHLHFPDRIYLWGLYILTTFVALVVPVSLFNRLRAKLALTIRRFQQTR